MSLWTLDHLLLSVNPSEVGISLLYFISDWSPWNSNTHLPMFSLFMSGFQSVYNMHYDDDSRDRPTLILSHRSTSTWWNFNEVALSATPNLLPIFCRTSEIAQSWTYIFCGRLPKLYVYAYCRCQTVTTLKDLTWVISSQAIGTNSTHWRKFWDSLTILCRLFTT